MSTIRKHRTVLEEVLIRHREPNSVAEQLVDQMADCRQRDDDAGDY